MFLEPIAAAKTPKSYLVFDLESAVIDHAGHARYQEMERWVPERDDHKSRRDYARADDPVKTARWVFQTVVMASAMLLIEHPDGNLDIARFERFGAPDRDERQLVTDLIAFFAQAPGNVEMVTWGGAMNDFPILLNALQRHGLTLPSGLRWMSFGGDGRNHHLDLMRLLTGGFKMKPVHMAEYAASLDIPAKLTAPAWQVSELIRNRCWGMVADICDGDVITTALLLARWRQLHDGRADIATVEDRLLRRICEYRPDAGYTAALNAKRADNLTMRMRTTMLQAEALAPWLEQDAA